MKAINSLKPDEVFGFNLIRIDETSAELTKKEMLRKIRTRIPYLLYLGLHTS